MTTAPEVAQPRPRRFRWESLTGGSSLLEDVGYRRLWLGRLASHTALNAVLYTLLVLAVGEGTGQSIKSALFIVAYLLPTATLGTVSGVLVDRVSKNLVLAALNGVRLALMVWLLMSGDNILNVYIVALLLAITSQFASPAEAAALPQIVRGDQLTLANSTNNMGGLFSQIVGFAVLPPLFLNTVGPQPLFLIAAVLFGISSAFFLGIHALGSKKLDIDSLIDSVKDVRAQFAEGWETLSKDMSAYMSVIIVVLASTASLVGVTLMPQFVDDVLDIPVQNAIYVFLPAAIGILAGLRTVHWLERRMPLAWLVGVGFVILCAAFLGLALTVPLADILDGLNPFGMFDPGPFGETTARIAVTIVFSTAAAFAYSLVGVASRSLVNERMPIAVQGRIFAAQVVLTNLASIPPILLAGFLSTLAGVGLVMVLTVFILVAAAGWTTANAMARQQVTSDAAS
jgi:MFS family permease